MPGIQVVTDSACDLPPRLIDKLGIKVVPLTIRFGDEEFVDRVELSPQGVLGQGRHRPRTCHRPPLLRRERSRLCSTMQQTPGWTG